MQAEAIFTGTELLLGQIINTNAALLCQELARAGISIFRQVVVGDNLQRIKEAIQEAGKRADIIITCGGLGPTEDDLTREALAEALELPLEENPLAKEHIIRFFTVRGRPMPPQNLKQALFPKGALPLDNPWGTALGIFLKHKDKLYACLPGPPSEFSKMLKEELLPLLEQYGAGKEIILSRVLKITGLGESTVEEKVRDLLKGTNPTLAILAKTGEIHLRITAKACDSQMAQELIKPLEEQIRERLKDHTFGADGDTLEGVVGNLLTRKGLTLAVAESCTGGLLAHRLTNIPGSSAYFRQGVVAYDNNIKVKVLGVNAKILASKGAVSEEVALAMARGVRDLAGTDIGIGITGIAGPGGGTPAKPVGLVYLALNCQGNAQVRRELFQGPREEIKWRATQSALDMLWRHLKGHA
ncbi:MAG: competence/damage-inducible protein A [Thermanaeromonas sp.]|uniref:competence/damage-inducible protein A n=1 Tax=Thermanaeromonas sp. TaxID=2003697 RepID=UPI0024386B75|nr:competence/damage-inducible protein A [Thermanaeromonas sp.]MCG0277921.1 competence/damage-inducible protein A [Thermanaeromonas sp.]